jgi:DNA-binding CsgD family transcriptional regulator/PAS domain-containing protein
MQDYSEDAVSDALNALYATVDGSESWGSAVSRLLGVTRSAHFTFLCFGKDGSVRQDSWPRVPECTLEYARDYADKDLRVPKLLNGWRGVMATQDLLTPEELARCPVHQEHYRRFPDAWNGLLDTIEAERSLMLPLFQRSAVRGEYGAEEEALLGVLSRHIARAYHLNEILPAGEISREGIIAAFDSLDNGIVILDQDGVALHMNAAAQQLVRARDGLSVRRGVLSATNRGSQDALTKFLADTLRVVAGSSLSLPAPIAIRRPGKPFPLILQSFVSPGGNGRMAYGVLKIRDGSEFRTPTVEMIRSATSLTEAEARLGIALVKGHSVADYAEETGLSEHTVRTHMRNMRDKLRIRRQSDLVAFLVRLSQG